MYFQQKVEVVTGFEDDSDEETSPDMRTNTTGHWGSLYSVKTQSQPNVEVQSLENPYVEMCEPLPASLTDTNSLLCNEASAQSQTDSAGIEDSENFNLDAALSSLLQSTVDSTISVSDDGIQEVSEPTSLYNSNSENMPTSVYCDSD